MEKIDLLEKIFNSIIISVSLACLAFIVFLFGPILAILLLNDLAFTATVVILSFIARYLIRKARKSAAFSRNDLGNRDLSREISHRCTYS